MTLEPGWLARAFEKNRREIATWPRWMRHAAGLPGQGITGDEGMTGEPIDWRDRAVRIATEAEWAGRNSAGFWCCPFCDGVRPDSRIEYLTLKESMRYHRGHSAECLIGLTLAASDTGATQEANGAG